MSKNASLVIVFTVISLLLQLIFAPNLTIWYATPNFLYVAALIIALYESPLYATVYGFGMGFVTDMLSTAPFGSSAFACALIAFAIAILRDYMGASGYGFSFTSLACGAFLIEFLSGIFCSFFGSSMSFLTIFIYVILPNSLFNIILACLIYLLVNKITSKSGSHLGKNYKNNNKLHF